VQTIAKIDLEIASPVGLVAYHKVLQLALSLGIETMAAERLAVAVAGHCRVRESHTCEQGHDHSGVVHLCCIIGHENSVFMLNVFASGGQEQNSLPTEPDAVVLAQLQHCLPDMSAETLLTLLHDQHQQTLQQRDDWKQKAGQLSLEMERQQQSMLHQSMHDTLTGLPNRRLLSVRARQLFQLAARQQQSCCLVLMDLNDFKNINDALGHHAGDVILQEVAARLGRVLRTTDVLVRLGGDEFAALLFNNHAKSASLVADKLQRALAESFEYQGQHLAIDASFGIAEYPAHGDDLDALMRRADVAMYHAKKHKVSAVIYDVMQDKHSMERMSLLKELDAAIKSDGMELYYQPQVHMQGEDRLSVEALIRWNHPQRGMVFPDQFIPLAEESGLIIPMTWWVLETAVRQSALWHQAGLPVNVSINISAEFLQEEQVVQRVSDCIQRYHLADNVLALEITENTLMEDPHQASKTLIEFNAINVDVSIDDFGTGYSSLAYLKHLNVDELKIDRSFIVGMSEYKNDAVIVQTVISMAHHMGLRVVAEGVEDRKDWDLLDEMGCDFIQGYYIHRPQPLKKITEWLHHFAEHGLRLDGEKQG